MEKKYQLPKDFAEKWVKALRGGEFGQTRFRLTDFCDNYCCLGIACKINDYTDKQITDYNNTWFGDTNFKRIPVELRKNNALIERLVELNDKYDKSFIDIADWIETNVDFV